jgi:hypothetical protein
MDDLKRYRPGDMGPGVVIRIWERNGNYLAARVLHAGEQLGDEERRILQALSLRPGWTVIVGREGGSASPGSQDWVRP